MLLKSCLRILEKMPIFTQRLNPVTGQNDWIMQQEDYDYKQEVSRSSYADMLHDVERNELYFEGLRRSVALLKNQNKDVHVLDIGTGTGLLSMMALQCGVDSVTACEAFTPMARCAREIFKLNGYIDKVNLIEKRSTEIECGPGKDMVRRANLLITEVFDTELIGEGALETFSHAKEHLLTEDALIVPSESTLYAQIVSSDLVRRWNKMSPIHNPQNLSQCLLSIPESTERCPGAAAVHDLQMSQISTQDFSAISEPIPVFQFDWSGRKIPLLKHQMTVNKLKSLSTGACDAVFMWWDLKMDPQGEVILSCAPLWGHPLTKENLDAKPSQIPWRDHWMQAVYYLPKDVKVEESQELSLISSHDEYSLWFDVASEDRSDIHTQLRPVCECGLHATTSRTRIGHMNDRRRRESNLRLLNKYVNEETVALFIGDTCLLAIVAAKLGARHVYVHQSDSLSNRVLKDFIESNKVQNKITVMTSLSLPDTAIPELKYQINLVFSEPYFDTSLLPWHSLQFMYRLDAYKSSFADDVVILPKRLIIKAVPVHFQDLWKIRAPLHSVCGFKMQPFDEMIDSSCKESDERVEPQPLWEYPCTALATPTTLCTLSIVNSEKSQAVERLSIKVERPGTLNGMALWSDWHFGDDECVTTGPVDEVTPGTQIVWDKYTRQGVFLFPNHHSISDAAEGNGEVKAETEFRPESGEFDFNFTFQRNS